MGQAAAVLNVEAPNVRAMVRATAARKMGMLSAFRDVEPDDLVQEGLLSLVRSGQRFDPAKASLSTFIGLVVGRSAISIWRTRSRLARRDAVAAEFGPGAEYTHEPSDLGDIVDWAAAIRAQARLTYGSAMHRIGRRHYRIDRVASLVLVMERLKLTAGQARALLAVNKPLLRAMGFLHSPGMQLLEDIDRMLAVQRRHAEMMDQKRAAEREGPTAKAPRRRAAADSRVSPALN